MSCAPALSLGTYTDNHAPATWYPNRIPHLFVADSQHPNQSGGAESAAIALTSEAYEAGYELSLLTPHGQDLDSSRPDLARRLTRTAHQGSDMRALVDSTHSELLRRSSDSRRDAPPKMVFLGDFGSALALMRSEDSAVDAEGNLLATVEQQLSTIIRCGRSARIHLVLVGNVDMLHAWFSCTDRDNIRGRYLLGAPCNKEMRALFGTDAHQGWPGPAHPHGVIDLGDGPREITSPPPGESSVQYRHQRTQVHD